LQLINSHPKSPARCCLFVPMTLSIESKANALLNYRVMDATTPPLYTDSGTAVENSNQGPLCNSPPVDTLNPALPYLPRYSVNEHDDQLGPIPPYPQAPPQFNRGTIPLYQNFQTPQRPGVYGVSNSQPYAHTVVRASPTEPNYEGLQKLACFVSWCCNPVFGLIAFVLIGKLHNDDRSSSLIRRLTRNRWLHLFE
jgi:hypothetical protein